MTTVRIFDPDGDEIAYGEYAPANATFQPNGKLKYEARFAECDREAGVVAQFSVNGGSLREVTPALPLHRYITPVLYFDLPTT